MHWLQLWPVAATRNTWRPKLLNKSSSKTPRMTVQVDAETHRALQSYSELTDIPIGKVIGRAVREWMNTTGKVHLEVMMQGAGQPIVSTGLPQPEDARGAETVKH